MTTGGEAFAWRAEQTIDFLDNLDREPRKVREHQLQNCCVVGRIFWES